MNLQFCGKLEFGDALQVLLQDARFKFQLAVVGSVLVVTSAATGEVRARRRNAIFRSDDDRLEFGAREPRFLFGDLGFDLLARQDEWNENSFTGPALVGRKTGKAVPAVDEFFDGEGQEMIVVWLQVLILEFK